MSLNADVTAPVVSLEELLASDAGDQKTGTDNVLSVAAADAPTAVVNVDLKEGASGDTTLNQSEIELIPQLNTKINFISEEGEKLVDMKDIQSDIENKDAISMVDADEVNATFEGLYTETFTSKRFSKSKSQVGLKAVKEFMAKKIKYTRETIATTFREVVGKDAPLVLSELQALQGKGIESAIDTISQTCLALTEIRQKLEVNPNLVFPFDNNEFINLGQVDFTSIAIEKANPGTPISTAEFIASFNELITLWKKSSGVRVLAAMTQSSCKDADIEKVFNAADAPLPIGLTLEVLLTMFGTVKGASYNAWLTHAAEGLIQDFNTWNQEASGADQSIEDEQAADAFITHSASTLSSITMRLGKTQAVVSDIANFAKHAKTVVCILANA